LKNGPQYRGWDIVTRARRAGFRLSSTAAFQPADFPGYTPQRAVAGGGDIVLRGENAATTYFFTKQ